MSISESPRIRKNGPTGVISIVIMLSSEKSRFHRRLAPCPLNLGLLKPPESRCARAAPHNEDPQRSKAS
jgi:hypothetical protein